MLVEVMMETRGRREGALLLMALVSVSDWSDSKVTGERKVSLLLGRGRGEVEASGPGNLPCKVGRPVR